MPGEVTQIILDDVKDRVDRVESRISQLDDVIRTMYKIEAKLDAMVKHTDKDDAAHRELSDRVLKCETQVVTLRTELVSNISDMEKKFLKWAAIAAAISGGAGASVLKALSLLG